MRTKINSLFLLSLIGLFAACSSVPTLDNFDKAQWLADRDGCEGVRSEMVDALVNQKDKLYGLNQREIAKVLGQPNRNELYTRNQQFFLYLIDGNDECRPEVKKRALRMRFSAVNKVNEISLEQL